MRLDVFDCEVKDSVNAFRTVRRPNKDGGSDPPSKSIDLAESACAEGTAMAAGKKQNSVAERAAVDKPQGLDNFNQSPEPNFVCSRSQKTLLRQSELYITLANQVPARTNGDCAAFKSGNIANAQSTEESGSESGEKGPSKIKISDGCDREKAEYSFYMACQFLPAMARGCTVLKNRRLDLFCIEESVGRFNHKFPISHATQRKLLPLAFEEDAKHVYQEEEILNIGS